LVDHLHRLRNDNSGAAAVIAAVIFPVVIGGMGLGAETGYWYLKQRNLQNAADLSAHVAGVRKGVGDSKTKIDSAALAIAKAAGLTPTSGKLTVNTPPASGSNSGDGNSIEVVVRRDATSPLLLDLQQ
jgi:Flp pilus assembly protein TadG